MGREKEGRANETIATLKAEVDSLNKTVEDGAAQSLTQETQVNALMQQKQDLSKLKEMLQNQVTQLAAAKLEFQDKTQKARLDLAAQEKEVQRLQAELATRKSKSEEEGIRKAQLSEELQQTRARIEETGKEIERNKVELDEQKGIMREYEAKVTAETAKVEEASSGQTRLEDGLK